LEGEEEGGPKAYAPFGAGRKTGHQISVVAAKTKRRETDGQVGGMEEMRRKKRKRRKTGGGRAAGRRSSSGHGVAERGSSCPDGWCGAPEEEPWGDAGPPRCVASPPSAGSEG